MATMSNSKEAVIVGVDFGTTYSGVAWCTTNDQSTVQVVNTWPGGASENRSEGQVPSVMAYSPKDTAKYRWGFDVTASGIANQLAWFKLLLNQRPSGLMNAIESVLPLNSLMNKKQITRAASQRELEAMLNQTTKNLPRGKTPVDIVTDYMKELVRHTDEAMEKTYPAALYSQFGHTMPIRYVLTVPAVWSDKAKDLTLKAARAAGMSGSKGNKRSVRLISEPEAAAVHCLQFYKGKQDCLKVNEIYASRQSSPPPVHLTLSPRM